MRDLYRKRCTLEAEEMTCAAQAIELLSPLTKDGETLLDVGCGSGYFYHSLRERKLPVKYFGFDASDTLIKIGQETLPEYGMHPEQLKTLRLEDFEGDEDHIVCMNVLTFLDNYHRPLERMLKAARKTLVLRESMSDESNYRYVTDFFLDPGHDLRVHINTYNKKDVISFIESYGFKVKEVEDRRTSGEVEYSIGHPHYWTFLVAERI